MLLRSSLTKTPKFLAAELPTSARKKGFLFYTLQWLALVCISLQCLKRVDLERRRRGMFVESDTKKIKAPLGATSSGKQTEYAAPLGLLKSFGSGKLQPCRSFGAFPLPYVKELR
jgi:hypothetical protein